MDWTGMFKQLFNKTTPEPHPITAESFLDVHQIYDKEINQFAWQQLIATDPALWQTALNRPTTTKKILTVTLGAGFSHNCIMTFETLINMSLTLRGATVETLNCDHALPVCLKTEYAYIKPEVIHYRQISPTLCKGCYKSSALQAAQLGFKNHPLSQYVTLEERSAAAEAAKHAAFADIASFTINNIAVGKHALAGSIRYFSHSQPEKLPLGLEITQQFLEAAIITYHAINRLFDQHQYDSVFIAQGLFTPHGIIKDVCEQRQIPLTCWSVSNIQKRFLLAPGEILNHMLYEDNQAWENFPWTAKEETFIVDYLNTRWANTHDWVPIPKLEENTAFKEYAVMKGIDLNKPIIGLLTNLIWEAFAEYESQCFSDMLTWIKKTILYFKQRPDLQLLIRIHPAEKMWNASRQFVGEEIKLMFAQLPPNVFVIESTENISTYDAMFECDAALIYQTQTGIELAAMKGVPIIVAGDAWIRNKGIAHEPKSADEYFALLDQLPFQQRLTPEIISRARKYAFHAFFRMMIPLEFFQKTDDWQLYHHTLQHLNELQPGNDPGLDIICESIMANEPFIFPAEQYIQETATVNRQFETV